MRLGWPRPRDASSLLGPRLPPTAEVLRPEDPLLVAVAGKDHDRAFGLQRPDSAQVALVRRRRRRHQREGHSLGAEEHGKVWWLADSDPVKRYEALKEFAKLHKLDEERTHWDQALTAIRSGTERPTAASPMNGVPHWRTM